MILLLHRVLNTDPKLFPNSAPTSNLPPLDKPPSPSLENQYKIPLRQYHPMLRTTPPNPKKTLTPLNEPFAPSAELPLQQTSRLKPTQKPSSVEDHYNAMRRKYLRLKAVYPNFGTTTH